MIRCPECGLRLRGREPGCQAHGSVTDADSAPPPAAGSGNPPEPAFALPGFDVKGVLGRGGFGVVYRAERVRDAVMVAIKVASPEQKGASERLEAEQEVLAHIGPPLVPEVYGHGVSVGHRYVVLELLGGETLADRLCQRGPVALAGFAQESQAILTAVEGVHARGYVHGDLKPENIFVSDARSAKLIDFGSAWSIANGGAERRGAAVLGTPEYMAPEQCEGRSDLGPATDIYALGVVLYEMLAGAPPFWGSAGEVREAQVSRRPARLNTRVSIATEIDDVVLRCLAKNPRQRFANVSELKAALSGALRDDQAGSG
ncbi:MAG TPA: serine/threonine-protein kinase, partial [Polyangiaceae bacterium]